MSTARRAAGLTFLALAGCASTSHQASAPPPQAPTQRLRICEDERRRDWWFCGQEGAVSEDEFLRRYKKVVDSHTAQTHSY